MVAQYIPSGRTSLVKRGKAEFQLQTEYGSVPGPRIVTTIFSNGQVLHKIERPLDHPVDSIENMHEVEDVIKSQHMDVSRIIREEGLPTKPESRFDEAEKLVRSDQIRALEGVEKVYLVTPEGKLIGNRRVKKEFQKTFKHVFKELPDMLKVFSEMPGHDNFREGGIYEIEPGRIILASTSIEFFLILLKAGSESDELASKINSIIKQ